MTIKQQAQGRIANIRTLWNLYQSDPEADHYDLGNLHDYGLDLSWNADKGCIVWLLSTGGPHEEIRFFGGRSLDHAVFVFIDYREYDEWIINDGDDFDTLTEVYDWFNEIVPREDD